MNLRYPFGKGQRPHTLTQIALQRKPRWHEVAIQGFLFFCGALSILTTIGIVLILGKESWLFFRSPEVSLREFLGTTKWQPAIGQFGIWSLVNATMMTTLFAILVAVPLGLCTAMAALGRVDLARAGLAAAIDFGLMDIVWLEQCPVLADLRADA
ncbi:MAG: hypothetical protein H5T66_11790, partial [Chloroflexi bacterium]|nr:hypothetical protein [Chloroflexota bacterium]